MSTITIALVGATGLVGSNILATLTSNPAVSSVHAYARRELPNQDAKIKPIEVKDSSSWPSHFPANTRVFISALGSTRGQAGGFDQQKKIDYDLNLDLAKAAKASGATTYVLISTASADTSSMFGYLKMKGDLEEAVKGLGFEHTVIVRPGLIVGDREDSRPPEFFMRKIAQFSGAMSGNRLKDFWAQDASVIGRAAVSAALKSASGENKEKVWMVGQADVVRLGRTEWKE